MHATHGRARGAHAAGFAMTAMAAIFAANAAQAQSWPERPIRMIVPFAAGAVSDVAARLLADRMSQRLGKSVIVDNRAGANGMLGSEAVARAAPDGYTILAAGNTTHAANPSLYRKVPYDPLKDFAEVAYVAGITYALAVGPGLQAFSVADLANYARSHPGKLSYATGNATSTIAAEMFKLATGADYAQVNYKGNPIAAADVASGSVTMMFIDTASGRPFFQGGKLRALAVAAGQRFDGLPEVPTMIEAGFPGFRISGWMGIWYPAKTPPAIVDRVNAEVVAARSVPDVAAKLKELGLVPEGVGTTAKDFAEFMRSELALWARVVRDAKIQPQ